MEDNQNAGFTSTVGANLGVKDSGFGRGHWTVALRMEVCLFV